MFPHEGNVGVLIFFCGVGEVSEADRGMHGP